MAVGIRISTARGCADWQFSLRPMRAVRIRSTASTIRSRGRKSRHDDRRARALRAARRERQRADGAHQGRQPASALDPHRRNAARRRRYAPRRSGLDVPVFTSNGNSTYAQMKQYASFLPKKLLFPDQPDRFEAVRDRDVRAAAQLFTKTLMPRT